jgi:hypothetical protein
MVGHQPHPQCPSPREPLAGSLCPPAPQEPPTGPLQHPTMLRPSITGPCRSKPQERLPVGVRKLKCPTMKNNNKIYQMKQ